MEPLPLVYQVLLALGLGLLVGFQRERSAQKRVAGIRTYPLITALGVLSIAIAEVTGGWIVAVALLSVVVFFAISDIEAFRQGDRSFGITSEMSALVMFGVGCAIGLGQTLVAVIVTGAVASLLQLKTPLHAFVQRVGEQDMNAIFRLVLVAMVILPVVPNRGYGPHEVINPFEIWMMVSLIVGISFGAYIAYKVFGRRGGTVLTGILGGLISSTATTFSYARNAKRAPGTDAIGAAIVVIASAVVIVRVLFEILVVAPDFLRAAAAPLAILLGTMTVCSVALAARGLKEKAGELEVAPPADLRSAVLFGLLYGGVLCAVAAGKYYFGTSGLYTIAAISGLSDMDAITLSTAQFVKSGAVASDDGWRMIVVGMLSNLAFKAGIAGVLGTRGLAMRIGSAFAITTVVAIVLIVLWR